MAKYTGRSDKNNNVEADGIYDLISYVLYGLVIGFAVGIYFENIVNGLTIGIGLSLTLGIIQVFRGRRKKKR